VAHSLPPYTVDLHRLRLDDAIALLDHSTALTLPEADIAPLAYLQALIDGLCALSQRDPITGLGNQQHFHSVIEQSIDVVVRSGEPALLLMLEIDNFTHILDNYGRAAADQVLQAVAKVLSNHKRPMDTVCRLGGEEFAFILPSCDATYGRAIADRIRTEIEGLAIPLTPGLTIHVLASIGGAFAPEWVRSTPALWTERALIQRQRAKNEGSHCVCLDSQREIYVSAEEKSMLFGHLALSEPSWIDSASGEASGLHAGPIVQRFI
jgi:two-component system cell cycle response regulator